MANDHAVLDTDEWYRQQLDKISPWSIAADGPVSQEEFAAVYGNLDKDPIQIDEDLMHKFVIVVPGLGPCTLLWEVYWNDGKKDDSSFKNPSHKAFKIMGWTHADSLCPGRWMLKQCLRPFAAVSMAGAPAALMLSLNSGHLVIHGLLPLIEGEFCKMRLENSKINVISRP